MAVIYLATDSDAENDVTAAVEDPVESAPQQYLHKEASEKLRTLVSKLPFTESKLIQLVYFEGYTLQEAGGQLGFSKSWPVASMPKCLSSWQVKCGDSICMTKPQVTKLSRKLQN